MSLTYSEQLVTKNLHTEVTIKASGTKTLVEVPRRMAIDCVKAINNEAASTFYSKSYTEGPLEGTPTSGWNLTGKCNVQCVLSRKGGNYLIANQFNLRMDNISAANDSDFVDFLNSKLLNYDGSLTVQNILIESIIFDFIE